MTDPMKNDFQNARKRGLHGWAQWRTDINDRLADSARTGSPMADIHPINTYLKKQLPRRHPANNPEMLMSYSADMEHSTCLKTDDYLVYGLPRAKLALKHRHSASTNDLHRASHLSPDDTRRYSDHVTYGGSDWSNSTGSAPNHKGSRGPENLQHSEHHRPSRLRRTQYIDDSDHRVPSGSHIVQSGPNVVHAVVHTQPSPDHLRRQGDRYM